MCCVFLGGFFFCIPVSAHLGRVFPGSYHGNTEKKMVEQFKGSLQPKRLPATGDIVLNSFYTNKITRFLSKMRQTRNSFTVIVLFL